MTLLLLACATSTESASTDPAPVPVLDTQVELQDTGPDVSYNGPAYEPCVSDAQCGPGSACTYVPGYAGQYCAPPCDQPQDCDLDGTLTFETVCLDNGRCARACEDSCPEELTCQSVGELELCAGEPFGQAGMYGTCSHPNVDGTDCPLESSCFGGDYVGTEQGVCLPWCDDGGCPAAPDDTEGVTPICYDVGLDHPVCPLLCVADAHCPEGQTCLDLGFAGICAPEGAEVPDYDI